MILFTPTPFASMFFISLEYLVSVSLYLAFLYLYSGLNLKERNRLALEALESVGLKERVKHKPNQLSGGKQQRVSIARAIAGSPKLILADEPTGALDSKTGLEIMKILNDLNSQGITIVLVTHEDDIANYGSRIIKMKDGKILEDRKNVDN